MEPFAVDGRVNAEQLQALLNAQCEYPTLDYKQSCDLGDRKARAEFVKDCAAMMTLRQGGYLVVGVDGHGAPVGAALTASMFDSANLRAILTKHLEGDIPVVSQLHQLPDGDVAMIYLGRRADGLFPIVKADMSFIDDDGSERIHLRAGDVIVRDGTRSRRWRTVDLPALLKPLVDGIRHEEQQRFGRLVAELSAQQQGATIARGAITNITWQLPENTFTQAITELSRSQDDRALRLVTLATTTAGKGLAREVRIDSDGFTDLLTLLDRLAACLGVGIGSGDYELVSRAAKALHDIYRSVGVDGSPTIADTHPRIWLEIAARVLGAMALAVRLEEWGAIRTLALRPVGESYEYRSWLRHADVWASRTNQFEQFVEGSAVPGLLIAVARQRVASIAALRLDLVGEDIPPAIGVPPAEHDPVLDSLCQADFLWCVIAASGGRGATEQYPSFAALYDHRTRPIIDKLLSDASLASVLMPELDQEDVAVVVGKVIETARNQGHFWL